MKSSSLFLFGPLVLGIVALWAMEGQCYETAGDCPRKMRRKCPGKIEKECWSDFSCRVNEKCCPTICGDKCVEALEIKNPVWNKPGKCANIPSGTCHNLNPPNYCESDGECRKDLKCCETGCGKQCVDPL